MSAPVEKVRAADLVARLRRHYMKPGPFPGGIFVPECGQNGVGNGQRCDALFVGFTSSSGRILVGHEIKVSRSDWLHELDQSAKADRWADECHAWYVVAPTGVVRPGELPHGWGLLTPNSRTTTRMDVQVKAEVRADHVPAWWAVRSIMARLDTLQHAEIAERRRELAEEHGKQLEKDRAELRARGTGDDPVVARIAQVLQRVRSEGGEDFRWSDVTDDDLVATLIDVGKAHAAATALRWDLARIVRDARELAAPFANAYGALAELLAEAEAVS